MALSKDVLGIALDSRANTYNDVEVDVTDAAAVAAYRLNFWKGIAEEIITHFKTAGVIPGTGLIAPGGGGPVTGAAQIN